MEIIDESTNDPPKALQDLNHFLAGEIAGMCGALLSHPMDSIKTQMQIEMIDHQMRHTHNTFTILHQTMLKDGIRSIYKGVLSPFLGYGFTTSFVFGINNIAKHSMYKANAKRSNRKKYRLTLKELSICGSITGFFHTFVITPIERIKIWSQSHKTNSIRSAMSLHKNCGFFKGLFGGIKYALCFQMLSYSVYFPVYEVSLKCLTLKRNKATKQWQSEYVIGDLSKNNKQNISASKILTSGGIAGVLSWIIGYPLDTIKTRIQSGYFTESVSVASLRQNLSISYYGIAPALYRAALLHSCTFLCYENVLHAADKYNLHVTI